MNFRTTFAAAAIALISASSFAQAPAPIAAQATPRIDAREAKQDTRITQGVKSGALTPAETARLDREQGAIGRAETKAKADGTVTAKERRHLNHMQNKASRDIHHQKHDAQVAPSNG